jgi:adenine-specific DNA-methyltransferase
MPTLNWIGKKAVENHHNEVPFRLLKRNNDLSVGEPDSGNLLVQGDNLEALKALLPYYAGQVKCIYIDPPYNTGNENWIYNDNVNSPEIKAWLGKVVGKEGEDLSRSDKWLCMMYPRLSLLWRFLRDDGAIFVSIDDDEGHYLKVLMDEIFGRSNFVANIVWQKKYTRANDAKYFSDNHDHIICYAKQKPKFKIGRVSRTEQQDKAYKNPDNDPNGPWKPTPLHAKSGSDNDSYTFSNGSKWQPPAGTYRRFNDATMKRLDDNKEIWFGKDGHATPQRKTYLGTLQAGVTPVTLWLYQVAGDNHIGRDEVKLILSEENILFDNPKPTTLLDLILQISTDDDSLVLDSFAGSGTTGHAVLQLNKLDKGQRKFLLVEMDSTVCRQITSTRLKKAIEGYKYKKKGATKKIDSLGSGFCYVDLVVLSRFIKVM